MFTEIGASVLQIYLWGFSIVFSLFIFLGGLVLIIVRTTGKKTEKRGEFQSSGIISGSASEFFSLLRMAVFFSVLWPWIFILIFTPYKRAGPHHKDIKKTE